MRIIPVISKELSTGNEVVFSGSKRQQQLLKQWFPEISYRNSNSAGPVFSRSNNQFFSWIKFIPSFMFQYLQERRTIKTLVREIKPVKIISDNRYGMYHRKVESILITHQLNIKVPGGFSLFQKSVNRINARIINKFDACYVPDLSPGYLAGNLSDKNKMIKIPVKYLGILSRFEFVSKASYLQKYDLLFIISGPENQRTVFENKILDIVKALPTGVKYLIVRGIISESIGNIPQGINYCASHDLKHLMTHAKAIVCRPGYTTLMDLQYLNKKALVVPTPGQSEQEYLAEHVYEQIGFKQVSQKEISANVLNNYLKETGVL